MIMNSSKDSQIADYNFSVSGGAVGFYPTGLVIGSFSLMIGMFFCPIVNFTSAGGTATFTWGFRTLDQFPVVIFPSAAPVLVSTFTTGTPFTGISDAAPFRSQVPLELGIFIGVEPLTGGRMLCYADYYNSDL